MGTIQKVTNGSDRTDDCEPNSSLGLLFRPEKCRSSGTGRCWQSATTTGCQRRTAALGIGRLYGRKETFQRFLEGSFYFPREPRDVYSFSEPKKYRLDRRHRLFGGGPNRSTKARCALNSPTRRNKVDV